MPALAHRELGAVETGTLTGRQVIGPAKRTVMSEVGLLRDNAGRNGTRLSRGQKRVLLWLPIAGLWLVLLLISKNPEGGRDWPSFAMLGVLGTAAVVGVWSGLLKLTESKQADEPDADEAEPKSRAALIYGNSQAPKADDEQQEE